jgi:hypothetical protein
MKLRMFLAAVTLSLAMVLVACEGDAGGSDPVAPDAEAPPLEAPAED